MNDFLFYEFEEFHVEEGRRQRAEGRRFNLEGDSNLSQPEISGTNVGNLDGTILNNKQILEIRNMFELGVATISEIANLYKLPSEIIERIIVKRQQ